MARAKAKINLKGCIKLEVMGRTFERGKPQVVTDAALIQHCSTSGDFSVEMLAAPKPAPVPSDDELDDELDAELAEAEAGEGDGDGDDEQPAPKPKKKAKKKAKKAKRSKV